MTFVYSAQDETLVTGDEGCAISGTLTADLENSDRMFFLFGGQRVCKNHCKDTLHVPFIG